MKVSVKLFAAAKDISGRDEVELTLPEGASVKDLRQALGANHPELNPLLPVLLIAINADYARNETLVPSDAAIACFPPVSGG